MDFRVCAPGEAISVVDEQHGLVIQGSPATSVGMVRGNNEDNVQLWALDDMLLGLVADGMGGAAGGEEASLIAAETVKSDLIDGMATSTDLRQLQEEALEQKLRAVLNSANRLVINKANQNLELQGMGSTATLVLVRNKEAIFAHIGDSRAYVIESNGHLQQVTADHSFVEALVASGHLTPEQAAIHPLRHVLYRALGQKDEAEEDVDIYYRQLKPGDRIILCSDGLPRHLDNADIQQIALAYDQPDKIAADLISMANERGGEDNVSVVVLIVAAR